MRDQHTAYAIDAERRHINQQSMADIKKEIFGRFDRLEKRRNPMLKLLKAAAILAAVLFVLVLVALFVPGAAAFLGGIPWRSILIKLFFLAVVAEGMLVYTRRADKRAGVKFKELFDDMRKGSRAVAGYLGKRWLGFCILAAACVLIS